MNVTVRKALAGGAIAVFSLLAVVSDAAWAKDVYRAPKGKKFESIPGGEVAVESFLCDERSGVYAPGATVRAVLRGRATHADVRAFACVTDFTGREVFRTPALSLACGPLEQTFEIAASKALGHFTVTAFFLRQGKVVGYTETAYVTVPAKGADGDPYFVVDKNFALPDLLPQMRRFGFGAAYLKTKGAAWAIHATPEERESEYERLRSGRWIDEAGATGFALVGEARPNVKRTPRPMDRVKRGLPAVSDADLAVIREHYRRMASVLKGRFLRWIVQEEFDAIGDLPDCRDGLVNWILANALITRATAEGIRAGDPSAEISVLGICCNDYMWETPPFQISRLVLGPNRGLFDSVALDAYTARWNACRGPYRPPEELLGKMLRDAAALSSEYGGRKEVVNSERCHALDYAAATDSDMCRQHAVMTARSMIVNRAVRECVSYTMHLLCMDVAADAFVANRTEGLDPEKTQYDIGVWKAVRTCVKGPNVGYVPRPALVAAGTTARELAFVKDGSDLPLKGGAYACAFTRSDGRPVVVLWSTNVVLRTEAPPAADDDRMGDSGLYIRKSLAKSMKDNSYSLPAFVSLDLPSGGTKTDLMGNVAPFKAGHVDLVLDETPVFIDYDGSRSELDSVLAPLLLEAPPRLK